MTKNFKKIFWPKFDYNNKIILLHSILQTTLNNSCFVLDNIIHFSILFVKQNKKMSNDFVN